MTKIVGFRTILPSPRVSYYNLAGGSGQAAKFESRLKSTGNSQEDNAILHARVSC